MSNILTEIWLVIFIIPLLHTGHKVKLDKSNVYEAKLVPFSTKCPLIEDNFERFLHDM